MCTERMLACPALPGESLRGHHAPAIASCSVSPDRKRDRLPSLYIYVRTGNWFDLRIGLFQCGDLCAATGRGAQALTLWAARAAVDRREGRTYPSLLENPPGGTAAPGPAGWDPAGHVRRRSAARR